MIPHSLFPVRPALPWLIPWRPRRNKKRNSGYQYEQLLDASVLFARPGNCLPAEINFIPAEKTASQSVLAVKPDYTHRAAGGESVTDLIGSELQTICLRTIYLQTICLQTIRRTL
jgi:hypothetical protein